MNMEPVTSGHIESVGYDSQLRVLRVQFKHGRTVDYRDVPPEIHESMMAAESVGKFLNANIKGPRDQPPPFEFSYVMLPGD